MANAKDLGKRTVGEEHWLCRRAFAHTQAEQGKYFGISEKRYARVERDKESMDGPPSGKPTLGDLCALARRRHCRPLRSMATRFGISHTELLTRERESDPRLAAAWGRFGYIFPKIKA